MSNMKALTTQFDTGSFSGAVATPTCSSCCCCCCCVATVTGGAIAVAKTVAVQGKQKRVPESERRLAIGLAVAALPLGVLAMIGVLMTADTDEFFYTAIALGIAIVAALLFQAGRVVRMKQPGFWALGTTIGIGACFAAELFLGAFALGAGSGGLLLYGLIAMVVITAVSIR